MEALGESGLGDDPRVIRFFVELAEERNESDDTDMSPEEARRRIDRIMKDKKHPYHDRNARGHEDAVKRVARYHDRAYGTPA